MGKSTWNINMLMSWMAVVIGFFTALLQKKAKETQRRSCSEKEKMEQSFACFW